MNRFNNIIGTISGIVGGGVLLFLNIAEHMSIYLSGLLGVGAFAGSYIFINAFKPKRSLTFKMPDDVSPELLASTLKDGEAKIKTLEQYASRISNVSVRKKVMDIATVIRNIYDNFRKDPKDIKYAKQFLSYYFDTSIK